MSQETSASLTRLLRLKALSKLLDEMIEEETARVVTNMAADGTDKVTVAQGKASYAERRNLVVTDTKRLAAMLPPEVLAEFVKPTQELMGAARLAGKPIDECVRTETTRSLRVEQGRSEEAKDIQGRIIAEANEAARISIERLERLIRAA